MSTSLNLRASLRAVRPRAGVLVLGLCVGLGAAQLATGFMPRSYEATASVVITADSTNPAADRGAGDLALAQGAAPTVARLAGSRDVAVDAAAALNLPLEAVLGRVSGSFEQGTQIITINANAATGARAAAIANAASDAVAGQLDRLHLGGTSFTVTSRPLDQASPPTRPASPKPRLNELFGALAGLLAGLGLIRMRERVDDRLRGLTRIEDELGLPILGVLPRVPRRYGRVRQLRTRTDIADAVDATVAALAMLNPSLPRRRLLVTSARDDGNKAIVASLLALGIAGDRERVVLIEGQLRDPALNRQFPDAAGRTVQKALADPGAATPLPGNPALTVLIADPDSQPDDGQTVDRRRLDALLDAVTDRGDVTIVHAPPVLAGADMATLARSVDGVLMVVETGVTFKTEALRAALLIQRLDLPVAGLIAVDTAGDAADWQRPTGLAAGTAEVAAGPRIPHPAKHRRNESTQVSPDRDEAAPVADLAERWDAQATPLARVSPGGDPPAQDAAAAQEVAAQEVAAQEVAAQEVAAREVGAQEVAAREAAAHVSPAQEPPAQTLSGADTPTQTLPGADTPTQTLPGADTPARTLPRADMPAQTLPGTDMPARTLPGADMPPRTPPAGDLTAQVHDPRVLAPDALAGRRSTALLFEPTDEYPAARRD